MLMEGMQDHLQVDFTLSPLGERTGVDDGDSIFLYIMQWKELLRVMIFNGYCSMSRSNK